MGRTFLKMCPDPRELLAGYCPLYFPLITPRNVIKSLTVAIIIVLVMVMMMMMMMMMMIMMTMILMMNQHRLIPSN